MTPEQIKKAYAAVHRAQLLFDCFDPESEAIIKASLTSTLILMNREARPKENPHEKVT